MDIPKKLKDLLGDPVVVELKCKTCKKVCGNVTFPPSWKGDKDAVRAKYNVRCDAHK